MELRNQRQKNLLVDRVSAYRGGLISLHHLIQDLDALEYEIEASQVWKRQFRANWWTLEQVYAVVDDEGLEGLMPGELRVLVDEALAGISDLIEDLGVRGDETS